MVKDDNNLKDKLHATNDSDDIVLNSNFSDWNEHVSRNLNIRSATGGIRYERGSDKKLLDLCREHAQNYQTAKLGKNTIMLTHPFYLHLSHMDELGNDNVRKEVGEYLNILLGFLNLRSDNSKAGVVVLETIHHYAAVTSLLLEKGLVDQVIFTLYDYGCPLDTDELRLYGRDEIFFGGGYNQRCLTESIRKMKKKISSGDIWAIEELMLNSPKA